MGSSRLSIRRYLLLGLGIALPWWGCAGHQPIVVPTKPPSVAPVPPKNDLRSHLEGTWEAPSKSGKPKQLTFNSDGSLRFKGALEFFNPGQWTLREDRGELQIILPAADDEKLQIFKLYVGDGVKGFDRIQKQITYHFDDQIWELNIAGWIYSKAGAALMIPPVAEPTIQ